MRASAILCLLLACSAARCLAQAPAPGPAASIPVSVAPAPVEAPTGPTTPVAPAPIEAPTGPTVAPAPVPAPIDDPIYVPEEPALPPAAPSPAEGPSGPAGEQPPAETEPTTPEQPGEGGEAEVPPEIPEVEVPLPPFDGPEKPSKKLPSPKQLTAMQISMELAAAFARKNGQGSLYALCRPSKEKCDKGLSCCGYVGSPFREKMPDICVRDNGECPRTYPGVEGGPCGPNRLCDEGMVCCDAKPFLGGLTSILIPTCQRKGTIKDAAGRVFC